MNALVKRMGELVGIMVCARAALGAIRRAATRAEAAEDAEALMRLHDAVKSNIDYDIQRGANVGRMWAGPGVQSPTEERAGAL